MTDPTFAEGDRVRVDIPDETDPDHRFHGCHGEIVSILVDDGPESMDNPRAKRLYRVDLDDTTADFRYWDLRPPIESSDRSV